MSVETIRIFATILSIAGSGILAYRVTGILSALSLVADAHELNIQQLMPTHKGDIYNLGNSTAHVEQAKKSSLLIAGFGMIILAGVLQLITLLMASS